MNLFAAISAVATGEDDPAGAAWHPAPASAG